MRQVGDGAALLLRVVVAAEAVDDVAESWPCSSGSRSGGELNIGEMPVPQRPSASATQIAPTRTAPVGQLGDPSFQPGAVRRAQPLLPVQLDKRRARFSRAGQVSSPRLSGNARRNLDALPLRRTGNCIPEESCTAPDLDGVARTRTRTFNRP